MIKILIIALTLASHNMVFAGFSEHITITGKIVKFDSKTVTLSQRGRYTKVPRQAIPKYFKLRPGHEVFAVMDSKKTLAELKKVHAKKSQKKAKKSQKKN